MGPGDVPKYPKEVSTKKMTLKNLNLKKLHRISENPPAGEEEPEIESKAENNNHQQTDCEH